ncbi:hypothetical protein [Thalassotalea fusca]
MKKTLIASLLGASAVLAGCVVIASPQHASFHQQETLNLEASTLTELAITAGAGSLKVVGDSSVSTITVTADIYTESKASKAFDFSLQADGKQAELIAEMHSTSGYWHGSSPRIDLLVSVPENMALNIVDGSGGIEIQQMNAAIKVVDGSGDIHIAQGQDDLNISDGSGDITIVRFAGNVNVDDGSGGISIENVSGDVTLDDGSGDIDIRNIAGSASINDGSGDLNVDDVTGTVTIDDGSGSISVHNAGGLKITEAGSGSLKFNNIRGEVEVDS